MIESILTGALVIAPMLGAAVSFCIGRRSKKARDVFACVLTASVFACALALYVLCGAEEGGVLRVPLCGMGLTFRTDGFRLLYACVASLLWAVTASFSPDYLAHYRNRNRYYFFFLLTLGATEGVFLSQDLFTTLVFFEIMSLASYPWVAHDETPDAMRAADTYLAVAVIGGLAALMGLFLLYHLTGTLDFDGLRQACPAVAQRGTLWAAVICILFGFGAKAGMFPLHIWLPKAHPIAPAPASAILSGVLTKSGVFGVIVVAVRIFPRDTAFGNMMLVIALVTMLLGAVMALFSVNLKKTLACSSMSQIGFILFGISMLVLLGEEGSCAAKGTVLHMLNHSLIKLVLFCAAGVVYKNLHTLDLNRMRGFGRGKPLLLCMFLSGAWSIAGLPLGSGYISKTLLHESVVELREVLEASGAHAGWYAAAEWLFLIAGGMTLAYMTKLFVVLFVEKPEHRFMEGTYMTRLSKIVLAAASVLLPVLGILPYATADRLAAGAASFFGTEAASKVNYFSPECLKGAVFTLLFGSVFYFGLVRKCLSKKKKQTRNYIDRWPAWLDLENAVYRPLLLKILPEAGAFVCRMTERLFGADTWTDIGLAAGMFCVRATERILGADTWTRIGIAAGSVFARAAERITDGTLTFLRVTVFRKYSYTPAAAPSASIGGTGDTMVHAYNRTRFKIRTQREKVQQRLLGGLRQIRGENRLVMLSMSYGLLMASAGVGMILLYLLLRHFVPWIP